MVAKTWKRLMAEEPGRPEVPAPRKDGRRRHGSDSSMHILEATDDGDGSVGHGELPGVNGSAELAGALSSSAVFATLPGAKPAAGSDSGSLSRGTHLTSHEARMAGSSSRSGVAPSAQANLLDAVAHASTASTSYPSSAAAYSHTRTLYLGPNYELQLPPPLYSDDEHDSERDTIADPWVLTEAQRAADMALSQPHLVRSLLSSPQRVRMVAGARRGGGAGVRLRRKGAHAADAAAALDDGPSTSAPSAAAPQRRSRSVHGAGAAASPRRAAAVAAAAAAALAETEAGHLQGREQQAAPGRRSKLEGAAEAEGEGLRSGETPAHIVNQRHLIRVLCDRESDAVVTEHIQGVVHKRGALPLNHVLSLLGSMGHVHALARCLTLAVAMGVHNEHTYSVAFRELHAAGRLNMVMAAFEEACRAGRDLGPIACSTLLHIATRERSMRMAWQLFDAMVANKMSLNRYAYNCMAHLAGLAGRLEDAVLIYNMMKSSPDPDHRPDSYTYSAMIRAATNSHRGALLPDLFNEMVAAQCAAARARGRQRPPPSRPAPAAAAVEGEGALSIEVWSHFIAAASRTGQPALARRFFEAGIAELGLVPSLPIFNALLGAIAKAAPLEEVLGLYSDMVRGSTRLLPPATHGSAEPAASVALPPLAPDTYTFNALLTAAAHHMATLRTLRHIRGEMARHDVALNAHTGTSLINALRRSPELTRGSLLAAAQPAAQPGPAAAAAAAAAARVPSAEAAGAAVAAAVSEAEAVMSELMAGGSASAMTYVHMAALYCTARRPADAMRVVRQMEGAGLGPDGAGWRFLLAAAEDADLYALAEALRGEAEQARQRWLRSRAQEHEAARAGRQGERGEEGREVAGAVQLRLPPPGPVAPRGAAAAGVGVAGLDPLPCTQRRRHGVSIAGDGPCRARLAVHQHDGCASDCVHG